MLKINKCKSKKLKRGKFFNELKSVCVRGDWRRNREQELLIAIRSENKKR